MRHSFLSQPTVFAILAASIILFSFRNQTAEGDPSDLKARALSILERKCNVCHQKKNPRRVFTLQNMSGLAPKINKQVFVWKRMPKGNAIRLTAEEKATLKQWINTEKTK